MPAVLDRSGKGSQEEYMQSRGMMRDLQSHSTIPVENTHYFHVKEEHQGIFCLMQEMEGCVAVCATVFFLFLFVLLNCYA